MARPQKSGVGQPLSASLKEIVAVYHAARHALSLLRALREALAGTAHVARITRVEKELSRALDDVPARRAPRNGNPG